MSNSFTSCMEATSHDGNLESCLAFNHKHCATSTVLSSKKPRQQKMLCQIRQDICAWDDRGTES